MINYTILLGFMLCFGLSYSQQTEEPLPNTISSFESNHIIVKDGTYQVILHDKRMIEPVITDEILLQIQAIRQSNEITYLELDEYTTIKVLPLVIINSENFSPLEKYSYDN